MKKHAKKEIVIRMPDLGLSSEELKELKKAFDNALVTTGSKLMERRARKIRFPPRTIVQRRP